MKITNEYLTDICNKLCPVFGSPNIHLLTMAAAAHCFINNIENEDTEILRRSIKWCGDYGTYEHDEFKMLADDPETGRTTSAIFYSREEAEEFLMWTSRGSFNHRYANEEDKNEIRDSI